MTMISKHWGYRVNAINSNYATIYCPTTHEYRVNGFGDMRAIYKELKELEKTLKALGFKGWAVWTQLRNFQMMKILTKLKSHPYEIDLKAESIWFEKEL
jgi:hypothetical protein